MRSSDGSSDVCSSDLLWRRGTGRSRGGADARAALLQHLFQDRDAADGDAGGEDRQPDRQSPAAYFLQRVGQRGERHGVPHGAPLLEAEGRTQAHDLHQPLERLSWLDRRGGLARRSEEHTSELQSLMCISYAVICLKKKIKH